jgi:hypothetical protein
MSKSFLKRVVDSKDTASSKRFITLIIASHFVIASFVILYLVYYVVVYLPEGKVDKALLSSLERILQYDFYIILSGLGLITSEGLVTIISGGIKPRVNESPEGYDPPNNNQPTA